jgi:hypothetical protein
MVATNFCHAVMGDKTQDSFVNIETMKLSKQWMHTYSSNKPNSLNEPWLSARKLIDGNLFLGQEKSADGGIHATRDHNNARSVLQDTKEMHRAI